MTVFFPLSKSNLELKGKKLHDFIAIKDTNIVQNMAESLYSMYHFATDVQ